MRYKGKKNYEEIIKVYFAIFPKNIKGDVRWLEFVKVKGYYWQGDSGDWWWEDIEFVD